MPWGPLTVQPSSLGRRGNAAARSPDEITHVRVEAERRMVEAARR